jgi:hypothetical protein
MPAFPDERELSAQARTAHRAGGVGTALGVVIPYRARVRGKGQGSEASRRMSMG